MSGKKRHLIATFGLATALVVTLAVGRLVGAQETSDCSGCSGWATLDMKIKEAGGWIDYGKTKNGIVAVALTPTPDKGPAVLTAFQEFDRLTHSMDAGTKLCAMCAGAEKIAKKKGTTIEVVPLRSGALYMMTSTKPKVVEELHAMYEKGCGKQGNEQAAPAACSDEACTDKTHLHAGKGGPAGGDEKNGANLSDP